MDDGAVTRVDLNSNVTEGDGQAVWEKAVSDNIIVKTAMFNVSAAGAHTLKYWLVNPGVVLQKLVVETSGAKATYLGPPESHRRP
jgi:hypothetical protein